MIEVGINASRNRAGGAKIHLIGLLGGADPREQGIKRVHLWSFAGLLDTLPTVPWLVKHNPPVLERSLARQVWWEYHSLPKEAARNKCAVLLNTDAGSVCPFRPSVVMSRDMLSFEKEEMVRYGVSLGRLRLIALKYIQSRSMRRADGVIFLTHYAARVVQNTTGTLDHFTIIPHGVGEAFRQEAADGSWPTSNGEHIRCLYVSNALPYKHQWNVIRAVGLLRQRGYNISLLLAGGGDGIAQRRVDQARRFVDPHAQFVEQMGFLEHGVLPGLLAGADLFVFASSCENMPNTLVEAMASGLPIASSDRGPMPEILQDGGLYFDPLDPVSIAAAIERIVRDERLRKSLSTRAWRLSENYSWPQCASKTWAFLREIAGD